MLLRCRLPDSTVAVHFALEPSPPKAMTDDERDEQFYRDTESVAHATLDDRQLAMLEPLGRRRKVSGGEMLFKPGQHNVPLMVILRGEVEVFEAREEEV